MPLRKSKQFEKKQSKAIDTSKQNDSINKFKKQLYKLEEKPESSQLPDLPHKNIGDLIKAEEKKKKDFGEAFSKLLEHIKEVEGEIEQILKNERLSRKDSVNEQLKVIEQYPDLMDLIQNDRNNIKKEMIFLDQNKKYQNQHSFGLHSMEDLYSIPELRDNWARILHYNGIDSNAILKYPEIAKLTTIDSYKRISDNYYVGETAIKQSGLAIKHQQTSGKLVSSRYLNNPNLETALDIAKRRDEKKILEEKIQKIKTQQEQLPTILQKAEQEFKQVIHTNEKAIKLAFAKTLNAYKEDMDDLSALNILNEAYLQRLKGLQKSEQMSKGEIKRTSEKFHNKLSEQKAQMRSEIQSLEKQLNELSKPEKDEDKILKEAARTILLVCKNYNRSWERLTNAKQLTSFYDFVEKNITHRLSNSLDELKKKCQEALHLFDEEIKKLHSQRQSELSDQPQEAMEKPSPADELQKYLETAFRDLDITPQRRHIVTSYLSGLFEKSHLDEETIAKFCQANIEEAKQVGKYIEQKYFISDKTRQDVIKLAVHLKHAFGFPIHDASIDKDFNIVESCASESSPVSPPRLDIDRQGRILKDHRVQRVYLIGLQDEAKPRALLAIQSANTGYSKFGAGTPLPTGGVVDVVTAQHTTRKQPNLYKATLSLETLQETHDQKEIDMPTLKFLETEMVGLKSRGTETVRNDNKMTALYDVTTFTGKVKDRPKQALPHDSGEYQETAGPCMVDLDKLTLAVKQDLGPSDLFRPLPLVYRAIKRAIAKQVLGEEKVPTSDKEWEKNGETCWADYEYSTSMNMFAKYLVLAYREELGLARSQ